MKILEITAFSAGICGVWTRVLAESALLAQKGHDIHVFSSDIFRGSEEKRAKPREVIKNVKITRFPAKFSFGQNTFFWDFEKAALKLKPDVIITHVYRQYYSTNALKVAKALGVPCFLVTHAPFLERKLRGLKLNLAVFLYDSLIGKRIINDYRKIIAITKWEIPHLLNLGLKKNKIEYLPNGIPSEFFKQKKIDEQNKVLFLGRVAPIKDLETLIKSFKFVKDKTLKLEIVGPIENEYYNKLINLIHNLKLHERIVFSKPVYDLRKKIKIIDSAKIFVLPSKREAMPQALIEAMARKKLVISSKTDGGKEIIASGKNGFLFEIGKERDLSRIINKIQQMSKKQGMFFGKEAERSVRQFSWEKLIARLSNLYKKYT